MFLPVAFLRGASLDPRVPCQRRPPAGARSFVPRFERLLEADSRHDRKGADPGAGRRPLFGGWEAPSNLRPERACRCTRHPLDLAARVATLDHARPVTVFTLKRRSEESGGRWSTARRRRSAGIRPDSCFPTRRSSRRSSQFRQEQPWVPAKESFRDGPRSPSVFQGDEGLLRRLAFEYARHPSRCVLAPDDPGDIIFAPRQRCDRRRGRSQHGARRRRCR